ncbi:MAG TPA: hypothetical protein VLL05_15290 [Terriglobales bacterium]|nr:hypothetical protein [Terriglobales bacterium]
MTNDANDLYDITGHGWLAGVSARPATALRLNFDVERLWTDNSLTRISPRKESRYRFQATYIPRSWALLSGSVNVLGTSNGDSLTDYRGHNRNYGLSATLTPRARFAFDLAYSYNDFQQSAFICFNDTPPTGVTLPVVTNAGSCAAFDPGNPLLTNGYYLNKSHYGMGAVNFKLIKRVTTMIGYTSPASGDRRRSSAICSPTGHCSTTTICLWRASASSWATTSPGTRAGTTISMGEKSFAGPTDPRYFHATNATVSLRWAF